MNELVPVVLTTKGLSISALELSGRGSPLVFLHGVAGNALSFKPLFDALAGRHILAIDLPFHGQSGPCSSLELDELGQRIFAAVDAYLGEPAIWSGHSWGGKVAAIIAAQNPGAVESLILLDPSPAGELAIPPELAVDAMFGGELGPWDSLDLACDAVHQLPQYANWNGDRAFAFRRGLVQDAAGKWRSAASREAMIAICTALSKDHTALIRQIDCPTLLVLAEQSLGWQETTNVALMSHAACVVLKSNHWLMADNPDDLAHTIGMWLQPAREVVASSRA